MLPVHTSVIESPYMMNSRPCADQTHLHSTTNQACLSQTDETSSMLRDQGASIACERSSQEGKFPLNFQGPDLESDTHLVLTQYWCELTRSQRSFTTLSGCRATQVVIALNVDIYQYYGEAARLLSCCMVNLTACLMHEHPAKTTLDRQR